ncbi:MAG: hypothetical protein WC212_07685 [Candidatus Delongbacteria bacterium]|nr:hypothetical protein [Candidatus Delongbacteria bacterium]
MPKRTIMMILLAVSIVCAKVNVGFYTLSQNGGDIQNKWIGYAIADITAEKLAAVNEINVITDDRIYDFLVSKNMNPFVNTASVNSFTGEIKQNFNLDYIVTGNYTVNPDNSLPVNITVYNLNDGTTTPSIVIQGFVSDLYTIVSYITQPVCMNMGVNLNASEISKIKQIDLTAKRAGVANTYKGKISLRNKDYKGATEFFEAAYKEDPSNSVTKKYYDEALSYFYGNGIFSYNLLESDYANSTPFRKQYMITRNISKSYKGEVLTSKVSPRNGGTHFDIELNIRLTLPAGVYATVNSLIEKFSSGGGANLDDGVYNPNATKIVSEREQFENNVAGYVINVKLLDGSGKPLHHSTQTFKTSFGMSYSGSVKNVFKNSYADTFMIMPSVSREIVQQTSSIEITVE